MIDVLLKIIDFFYFPFKKFMPLRTYRYAACGGGNLVLDMTLYFICFHFVFDKQKLDLYVIALSPHIASLFVVFPITFIIGFLLNRFVVFPESTLPMGTQFIRYLSVGLTNLVMSYLLMKLLVDLLHLYPTPSRFLTIVITVIFSYIMQSKFSFKIE